MTPQAVLFDLDGVLVFSKEVWFHLLNAAARHFGAPPITRDTQEQLWGQGIRADTTTLFLHSTVEQVEAYYNAHFLDHAAHLEVEPDAARVLAALDATGLATAVISNTPTPMARGILDAVGLTPREVVGSTDVAAPKPAPDMVHLALQRLAVTPSNALMVGDTRYDREAAQAAGVPFAGYRLPGNPHRIERLADLLPLVGLADTPE